MSVSFNCVGFIDRRTQDLKDRGDAIERRRLEAPQPITAKVVSCPIYRNTHVADFGQWSAMNLQALTDYWNALVIADDDCGPLLGEEDFFLFTRIQHEREQDRMKELREAYMDRTEYTGRMGALR